MTIVVLGIDALEFDLVKKYKLVNLQQKGYSKLSLEDFPVIVTPPIWASMITGVVLKEMLDGFTTLFHSSQGLWSQVKNVLPWKIRRFLGKTLIPLKTTLENPMDGTSEYLSQKAISTIFDEVKGWHNEIPGYNLRSATRKMKMPREAFEDEKIKKHWLKKRYILFKKETEKLFEVLSRKEEYDLIFWYTNWLDSAGHLEQGHKLKTLNRYLEINFLVGQVREHLSVNNILYIISDHGMISTGRLGYHSNHGFFSSSNGQVIGKPKELYRILKINLTGKLGEK